MKTVDEFWPTYVDEFKERMVELSKKIKGASDIQLILLALGLIMEEQQRTGHRSEGWPSDMHNATRFVIHNRTHNRSKNNA